MVLHKWGLVVGLLFPYLRATLALIILLATSILVIFLCLLSFSNCVLPKYSMFHTLFNFLHKIFALFGHITMIMMVLTPFVSVTPIGRRLK